MNPKHEPAGEDGKITGGGPGAPDGSARCVAGRFGEDEMENSKLTFRQLMNNIAAMEAIIKRKVEACRILAKNKCFDEAEIMAFEAQNKADRLRELFDDFDGETSIVEDIEALLEMGKEVG